MTVRVSESVEDAERSYVGELAHSIGFDSDVVLLELLFDLIDACGDVLGLRADKGEDKQQTPDQIRWSDIHSGRLLPSTGNKPEKLGLFAVAVAIQHNCDICGSWVAWSLLRTGHDNGIEVQNYVKSEDIKL